MSQEYTEDKDVSLQPLSSGRRLLEALLIIVALFAVYLMIALVSFNPSDPSWSQTAWHEPIHNLGGGVGAWLADTLLFIFGVMAYAIPPVILGLCWITFRQRDRQDYIDYFAVGLRLIGVLALVITTCGLAALNADDIWYFASGGVIGSLVSNAMAPWFNGAAGTLTLLCIWAAGLTLYTGWSWLTIAEKIGGVVMGVLTFASNRSRDDDRWQDEEDEPQAPVIQRATPVAEDDEDILLAPPRKLSAHAADDNTDNDELDDPLFAPVAKTPAAPAAVEAAAPTVPPAAASQPQPVATAPVQQPPASPAQPVAASQPAPHYAAAESETPPLYHFDIPEDAAPAGQIDEDEPVMGNWRGTTDPASPFDFSSPQPSQPAQIPAAATVAAASFAASQASAHAFMPEFSASSSEEINPQVKQGIGPELPRPNPVKLPTRRELASYGIKLPSQRMAEEKAKQEEQRQPSTEPTTDAVENAAQEAELRDAWQEQQQQRYGEEYQPQAEKEEEEAREQAALARQFADQQQQRYQPPQPDTPAPAFSIDTAAAFDFSPMDDLVDDGPGEPLFTIAATPEAELPQQSAQWSAQQPVNTPPRYEPPTPPREHDAEPVFAPEPVPRYVAPEPPVAQPPVQPEVHDAEPVFAPEPVPRYVAPEPPVAQPPAQPAYAAPVAPAAPTPEKNSMQDSLFHPFLVRHEQPMEKPSTPLPVLELLTAPPEEEEPVDMFALEQTARLVEARLADYRVKAEVVGISPGPVITRFELDLAPGVKAARISNLSRDLARSLSAVAVRVVEVIPGKPYVGLELPNKKRQTVYLREVLDCATFRDNPSPLAVVLGKDIAGQPVVADLAKMPHLLVAGTTGSGKSVGVNTMIISMLYKATPDEVRFIMIDPKMLELSVYEGIPHLLTEVVTDMKDAANALRWSVGEMERRYKLMSALGVRNLAGYNEKVMQAEAMGRPIPDPFWKPGDSMDSTPPVLEKLPYIVVLVDEFADLMMAVGKKVEELIARLAQKARAAGIHLVLATQRPSVDVITGLIKANIPTRIAFTVSSKIDSRTILDQSGAESLLGMGDMLYMPPNSSMPIRVHGAFVRDEEVHAVVSDWKARGRPQYIESITAGSESEAGSLGLEGDEELDPLFDQAVAFIVEKRRASISGVQRQFRIGYNRAARIIEQMEVQGIVSPPGHNGNREVLSPPPHEM